MEITPERIDNCKTCKYRGLDETQEPCAHCIKNAVDNYEPMTNGDYIRSLSDEELAQIVMCPKQFDEVFETECEQDDTKCNQCTLRWLEQENKSEYFEGEADGFEFAIEIVKGGGVDGN